MQNRKIAYFLLRIILGINMFGHGLVRIPKISAFAQWMTETFKKSILSPEIVNAFATVLPFVEATIGILLIIGYRTKETIIAGSLLMAALIFGSSTIENWEAVSFQMIYVIVNYLLLTNIEHNCISVDTRKKS